MDWIVLTGGNEMTKNIAIGISQPAGRLRERETGEHMMYQLVIEVKEVEEEVETKTEINRLCIVLAYQVQHIADSAKKYLTGFSEAPMVVLMSTGTEMTRGKIAWTFSPLYHHHHHLTTNYFHHSSTHNNKTR